MTDRRPPGDFAGQRYQQIVEAAPNAMVMSDQNGTIVMVNAEAEAIFGYERREILGQSVDLLLPDRFRQAHPQHRTSYFAAPSRRAMGAGRELYARRKDGGEFPVEIGLNPIETDEGIMALSVIVDITERQRIAARLHESLGLQAAIVASSADAVVSESLSGVIMSWNPGAERMFGYAEAEVIGRTIFDLVVPDDYREELLGKLGEIRADGMVKSFDTKRRRKDGRLIDVTIILSPLRNLTGDLIGLSVVKRDISERLKAQQQLIEHRDELERSNEELATFAYVASHDLKSPLRGIFQLSTWIEEDLQEQNFGSVPEHMALLRSRIARMDNLLDDLLAYSRAGRVEGGLSQAAVADLAVAVFEMQSPPPGMSLELADSLPVFSTLVTPFEQVLRNLFSNAIKHHDRPAAGHIGLNSFAADERFYAFEVSDDGPGIPPQYHERVFGMFQTLRPRDEVEGSGMGLALVKKIVETYGGTVTILSDGTRGCTIRFTWPRKIKRKGHDDSAATRG